MVPSHIELSFNATSDNSQIFLSLVLRFLSLFYIKQFFCPFTLAVINSRSSLTEKIRAAGNFSHFPTGLFSLDSRPATLRLKMSWLPS